MFANKRAETEYKITDTKKFDEFLNKCKVSSTLLKPLFDSSTNSLKKVIIVNYA